MIETINNLKDNIYNLNITEIFSIINDILKYDLSNISLLDREELLDNLSNILSNNNNIETKNNELIYIINTYQDNKDKNWYEFYFKLYYLILNKCLKSNTDQITLNTIYKLHNEFKKHTGFNIIENINNNNFKEINNKSYIVNDDIRLFIELLGLDNVMRFETETGFFTHKSTSESEDFEMIELLSYNFDEDINYKDGNLSYDDFLSTLAKHLNMIRKKSKFMAYPNYDFIKGSFREKYSDIFIRDDAPQELKDSFYYNKIYFKDIKANKDWIPYLVNCNLKNALSEDLCFYGENEYNFIETYSKKYGNLKLLNLIKDYGNLLSGLDIERVEDLDKEIRKKIYQKICNEKLNYYDYLKDCNEFILEYHDLFINKNHTYSKLFYDGKLNYNHIALIPEVLEMLKGKNLHMAFRTNATGRKYITIEGQFQSKDLIDIVGNDNFLKLCYKYGRFLETVVKLFNKNDFINKSFDEIDNMLKEKIINECKLRCNVYNDYIDNKKTRNYSNDDYDWMGLVAFYIRYPDLFLSDNCPLELKNYFYADDFYNRGFNNYHIHKEWLPYLDNREVAASLRRSINKSGFIDKYFDIFGIDKGVNLGIKKPETVTYMIISDETLLMKKWYDKTGGKFIPDVVIMNNFNIDNADKFLSNATKWSKLVKINGYNVNDTKDALIKIAYCFGVFDSDQKGFKELYELLTGVPTNISSNYSECIDNADDILINKHLDKYNKLKELLIAEGFNLNNNIGIFKQLYRKKEDGSYLFTINSQKFPKSSLLIRELLEYTNIPCVISSDFAHKYFGGLDLRYDPEFREFFINNLDKIFENQEYNYLIPSIHKRFAAIKATCSNNKLTWENACNYVMTNKYEHIDIGNEKLSQIVSLVGYSQKDFEILQEIYDYGKKRVFSSIPRISNERGKYNYEILRLDDPLAIGIGNLTDCCQAYGNAAETCMEHSMIDNNGRIFVIRDNLNNIVAQSWVWRNKDVVCFDNIEIPHKAFARAAGRKDKTGKNILAEEVYDIYKQAARELILEDERVYKKLLNTGKISKEEYDGLRIGMVTVGLGYNDIAEVIKSKASPISNKEKNIKPLNYEPVKSRGHLYTNDSRTQYVLDERNNRIPYNGDNLIVHKDDYMIYDNSNFREMELLSLSKLELVTNGSIGKLSFISNYNDGNLVSEIARYYGLNLDTTRIILHPNFGIIFDISNNTIRIGDLVFNTKVTNGDKIMDIENEVIIQLKLAFEQISNNMNIDVSRLNNNQLNMYNKVIETQLERGASHGK